MTISILQERQTSVGNVTSASISLAFSSPVTAASSIHAMGAASDNATSLSMADNVNGTYGAALDTKDASAVQDGAIAAHFRFDSSASGTITVTSTPNISTNFQGIVIREIGGTSGYDGVHAAQIQLTPGTGTDAVSAGSATPLTQPGLCSAITLDPTNELSAPTAGTGFTSGIAVIDYGSGTPGGLTEHKRYTSTAAFAATWTSSRGSVDDFISFAAYFKETGAAAQVSGAWPSRSLFTPGAGPGKTSRFYQSPKAFGGPPLTLTLSGQSATTTPGTIGVNSSTPVTGQALASATGSLGSLMTLALTGSGATFSSGTLVPSSLIGLLGQSATFTAGNVTVSGNLTLVLTGQASAFGIGTFGVVFTVPLVGQPGTSTNGTLVPGSNPVLAGQAVVFSLGSLSPSLAIPLVGQNSNLIPGILLPVTALVALGQSTALSTGIFIPSSSVPLLGLSQGVVAGTIIASGGDSVITQVASMLMMGRGVRKNR